MFHQTESSSTVVLDMVYTIRILTLMNCLSPQLAKNVIDIKSMNLYDKIGCPVIKYDISITFIYSFTEQNMLLNINNQLTITVT